ncbi:MAG: PQQ-dependent sugar dehydrogenase [Verrucomicrobiota bacterium]
MKPHPLSLVVMAASGFGMIPLHAQALSLQQAATGFSQPLFVTAPEGDSRLFVVEKGGTVRVVQGGSTLPAPFLDLSSSVSTAGEGGLLGLAFDPNYATNGRLYVNYIDSLTNSTVVARYTVSGDPNTVSAASGQTIISVAQPAGQTNHKAGWIGFRPGETANLYIATGDGGGSNDPGNRAQNLSDNLGKILRLDVSAPGPGYTIPAGNPFAGATAGNDEIWAYGLRNPYRNSFDRQTGDFYIADVGQGAREEVNFEAAAAEGGNNYGWRAREGTGDNPGVGDAPPAGAVDPVYDYTHASQPAGSASITGGYVYRGDAIPDLDGTYFHGDFVNGTIYTFSYDGATVTGLTDRSAELNAPTLLGPGSISSFGEDGFGELYVVDIGGTVYKLVPEPTAGLLACLSGSLLLLRRRR